MTLLAWLAAVEGTVSNDKLRLLRDFANRQQDPSILELALQVAVAPDVEDLKSACKVVKGMPLEGRHAVLQWAFLVATADKRLSIGSNYVLRFLIDLTGVDFSEACRQADRNLPLPADVSNVHWWQALEGDAATNNQQAPPRRRPAGMSVQEAYSVLQLGENPSQAEIATAFRRMASLYHPDRHAQAGLDAQRTAAKNFARARKAFELLSVK